jgi:2-polyprenyl-3-methyl-5-hydroxy-6-metoxy-1,4-benzoquinol methylase
LANLGQQQDATFYNERLTRVMIPYEESPWRPIYDAMVNYLQESFDDPDKSQILDLGCGTGRCAEAIRRAGFKNYLGIDFSSTRIEEAQRYLPQFKFLTLDVFSQEANALFQQFNTFILTEFLEHIEGDIDLIKMIPSGALVLFSVPNFNSAGHVRYFSSLDQVINRYEQFIEIERSSCKSIPKPNREDKVTFIAKGGKI